jgi:hypothetical protein
MRASASWITISALVLSTAACGQLGDGSTTDAYQPPGARSSEFDPVVGLRSGPPHLPNVEVGPNFGDRPDNAGGGPGQ